MLPEQRVEDEPCPVTDQMLGEIYRASEHGLNELIATVPPKARALLAVFCYRRAHLASIGLAIAASCEEDDLTSLGGNAGAMLFERSRKAPQSRLADAGTSNRRKITVAVGPLRTPIPDVNKEDSPLSFFSSARARLWPKVDEQTPRAD
jgi:hypothetical protein